MKKYLFLIGVLHSVGLPAPVSRESVPMTGLKKGRVQKHKCSTQAWLLISLLALFLYGCADNAEFEQSVLQNAEVVEVVDYMEDFLQVATSDVSLPEEDGISYEDFIKMNSGIQPRSPSSSNGVLKAVGYANMTKLSTGKRMFKGLPKNHPLSNNTIYPYTRYIFGNRVTIPHSATINIPTKSFPAEYPIGWNPNNLSKYGYRYVLISESANGDIYELQTVIDVIEYNASGQHIGKCYFPLQVGNPATDMYFEYAWQMNDWFN